MELTSGVEKYLKYLISDDSIYLVLIYGSTTRGNTTESSDLDVFVCGNLATNYRKAMVIDNKELEINFVDVDSIENKIDKGIEGNNSYYESVLNNNIVLKNSYSLLEKCKKYLDDKKRSTKKSKRDMPLRNKFLLNEFYYGFRKDLDLYNYFNFLDEIRMTLAYMYNYSSLNVGKVYDMYSNREHALKDYCLNLPSEEFIHHYDLAIRNQRSEENMKWLMESVSFDPFVILRDCEKFNYFNDGKLQSILIHMDKMVNKSIKFFIENNPYQDYVYHVVINHIYRFYEEIYGDVTEEFMSVFNSAKVETDNLLKINYLKQLFSLLEGKYAFDYKNYTLIFN